MTNVKEKLKQLLKVVDDDGENAGGNKDDKTSETRTNFKEWFLKQFVPNNDEQQSSGSSSLNHAYRLEEFAVYFLNSIRQETEVHLKCKETDTPKCTTPVRATINQGSSNTRATNSSTPVTQKSIKNASTTAEPTNEACVQLDESSSLTYAELSVELQQLENAEQSFNHSLSSHTSTPVRRGTTHSLNSSNHSQSRRSVGLNSLNNNATTMPNSSERKTRFSSDGVGVSSSSLCLGDFLVTNSNSSRSNSRKNSTNGGGSGSGAGKPKKRVVPTKVLTNRSTSANCDSSPFGNKSAFSQENNILKLSSTEIDDRNQCSILEARMSLKLKADEISKELETTSVTSAAESKLIEVAVLAAENSEKELLQPLHTKQKKPQDKQLCRVIERIASIYSILVDMNFTTNLLNELSFLINILNGSNTVDNAKEELQRTGSDKLAADMQQLVVLSDESSSSPLDGLKLLQASINCAYFALCVLDRQRNMLAMLDLKSLNVVLYNEQSLSHDLKVFLTRIYERKQQQWQQFKKENEFMMMPACNDKSFNNVYYQEDKDSRQNFPSNNEFAAFKSQRDIFYKALKYWESNHLQPYWNFQTEIAPKIREIFRLSEHSINMAHFAELFVSQLLLSVNYATSPEEIGVEIDLQKFSKLAQRLVAPSNFSVDYQFPNHQAFFRDFILEARSLAFLEQLKLVIYAKLVMLNDSTLELINILNDGDDDDEDQHDQHNQYQNELILRPQVLSSLHVLAKFLGYISVLPFNNGHGGTGSEMLTILDKKQIELRSLVLPNFNFEHMLRIAIKQGKLLITLPWIVQYLVMLDAVTLQLKSYVAITEILFSLYMEMNVEQMVLLPSTVFIIRCCLGWLFETKPILADQYYNFRINYQLAAKQNDNKEIDLLYTCSTRNNSKHLQVSPLLESILNVICPFLADFRVSIMPAKYAAVKYVSRSGRYRHITTRITEPNTATNQQEHSVVHHLNLEQNHTLIDSQANKAKLAEHKLIEAFLHSQNTTMRRLIDFIIERIYKSTVKDLQFQILLPSKNAADKQINEITSQDYKEVFDGASFIYETARFNALKKWDEDVPKIIKQRISLALEALLPKEPTTEKIVKQTYHNLIRRKTESKVYQWRCANIAASINFYCSNLDELTQKICKANKKKQQQTVPTTAAAATSELIILKSEPSVSNLLDELQFWVHCTSMRPDLVPNTSAPIETLLRQFPLGFKNKLPAALYRIVEVSIVQLLHNLLSRHPNLVTKSLIKMLNSLWSSKEMQQNVIEARKQRSKLLQRDNSSDGHEVETEYEHHTKSIPCIFDGLVTSTFIESIGVNKPSYNKLKEVLVAMIRSNVISVNFVNDLFIPIYKRDWHPSVLNEMAHLLQAIAEETKDCQGGGGGSSSDEDNDDFKSNLFMEVLADFARDVDNF